MKYLNVTYLVLTYFVPYYNIYINLKRVSILSINH